MKGGGGEWTAEIAFSVDGLVLERGRRWYTATAESGKSDELVKSLSDQAMVCNSAIHLFTPPPRESVSHDHDYVYNRVSSVVETGRRMRNEEE